MPFLDSITVISTSGSDAETGPVTLSWPSATEDGRLGDRLHRLSGGTKPLRRAGPAGFWLRRVCGNRQRDDG
jgi:hypothetical protein